jgi:hypothetical protein
MNVAATLLECAESWSQDSLGRDRNPANADRGRTDGRRRSESLTVQACLTWQRSMQRTVPNGPWRGLDDLEMATVEYIDWSTPAASNANSATAAQTNTRPPGTPKPNQITSHPPRPEAGNHRSIKAGVAQIDSL